jgi:hypothetical protein
LFETESSEMLAKKTYALFNLTCIFNTACVVFSFVCGNIFSAYSQQKTIIHQVHEIDQRRVHSSFNGRPLKDSLEEQLIQQIENLNHPLVSLKKSSAIESEFSRHVTFDQQYKGISIYRAAIKINMDKDGAITSLFDNSYPVSEAPSMHFPDSNRIRQILSSQYIKGICKIQPLFFYEKDHLIPVLRASLYMPSSGDFMEFIFDAQEKIIYSKDLNSHYTSKADTLVPAKVFMPDPLTSAHVKYGAPYQNFTTPNAPYRNHNDSDVVELNNQRFQVNIHATLDKDTFRLISPYVIISEFSDPVVMPVYSTTPGFLFTRAQSGFEDVNAFFNIYLMQKHVQAIGFFNVANYQIQVDTHANGGADNSNFSYFSTPPRLNFGIGGVPDAQDADVVVHEYGHAINYSIAPGSNEGAERMTIDEGNCDYLAASYSRSIDSYLWQYVFNWDGHNEFWRGRVVQTTKTYSTSLSYSSIYTNADIWSATIMQVWELLGRDTTDRILIQSMYGYAKNMTMPDAAKLFIHADKQLYRGKHVKDITNLFVARGILSDPTGIKDLTAVANLNVKVNNSLAFAQSQGPLVIDAPEASIIHIKITGISGQIFYDEDLPAESKKIFEKPLPPGIYILNVTTEKGQSSFKIVKF